jgi:hypothetical protein
VSYALEGGRARPDENAPGLFWSAADLQRPAALRVAYRVDLEIQLPEPPSGFLPEEGAAAIQAIADVLESAAAFSDIAFPTFEERAEAEKERQIDEAAQIAELSVAVIQGIVALDWTHTRNPPSVADLLEVTIPSRHLPIDLRVPEFIRIQAWPFVRNAADESFDDRLDRCKPGDPGHFAGVVDNLETDRKAGTLTLACRDLTAIPLGHEVSGATMDALDMEDFLEDIVSEIMTKSVPGGDQWAIETRGKLRSSSRSPGRVLADEKRKKVTRQKVVLVDHLEYAKDVEQVPLGVAYDPGDAVVTGGPDDLEGVTYTQLHTSKTAGGGTSQVRRWRIPEGTVITNAADNDGSEYEVRNVTKMITVRVPPTTEAVFGSQKLTAWDAITKISRKLGVIPEVGLAEDGSPMVVLVDAEDYLDGRFFRAFSRYDIEAGYERKHRIVTFGRDIAELAESRDLTAGDRVDWVEVVAVDPDRGVTRTERYGKPGDRSGGTGVQIPHHGVTKRAHLKRLAKQAWLNLNSGELELTAEVDVPWTTGGGVDDPDLFQAAAGTIVEVAFASAPRYRGKALEDILRAPPIFMNARAAKALGRASERKMPSLVFQVAELVHSGSGEGDGAYGCQLTLQTMLDDGLSPEELEAADV